MEITLSERMRMAIAIGALLFLASGLRAQVTNGQKPHLPPPFATRSSGNPPEGVPPPEGFLPSVPAGFRVNIFAKGFREPRWLAVAPNGDVFLADSGAGKILILRDPKQTGGAQERDLFASGLDRPFGIAFRDDYVYVGDTDAVLRFRYDAKTSRRLGEAERLMSLPRGGHWTRALAFNSDGQHLFVSVGSASNIDIESDKRRG